MTEQNPNPDVTDDTEGHFRREAASSADDVTDLDSMNDDTEGHARRPAMDIGDEDDDVEGHTRKPG
jgi:hypothetical protein